MSTVYLHKLKFKGILLTIWPTEILQKVLTGNMGNENGLALHESS